MSSPKPKLVFAGLGAMGYGMASHLLSSGFPVLGYDVFQPFMLKLVAEGGQSANTPREAAKEADFFLCMVANSQQATPLLFDEETGAVQAMPKNATIIMCSTVAPAYINEILQRLHEANREDIQLLDCPVSGGAVRAASGSLSIFSSGSDSNLANASPILSNLSRNLYTIPGGLGAGSKAKLIHQIFAGINIALASEAMGLAAAAGLNTSAAFEALATGDAASWVFTNRVPHMLDPTLPPYSAMTIIAKDVGIITATSRKEKFPLPLLAAAEQLYVKSIFAGWGKDDDCHVVRLYLPHRENLVEHQAQPFRYAEDPRVDVEDVRNLMVGVYLAGMAEAMAFCVALGLDVRLMYDIVSNAAGASKVFVKYFDRMEEGGWSLRAVPDVEEIRDQLSAAVDKTYSLRYPLYLASAALQEFNRQLR